MKVSVITATFNCGEHLEACLRSVSGQDHVDIEHIVIDACSMDTTRNIIHKYQDRIAKYVRETDSGIYDGINKGLKLSTGDIIGILNADDVYADPKVIGKVVKIFADQKVDCIYGDIVYVDKRDPGNVIRYWRAGVFDLAKMRSGWMPPHPALFIRRSVYEKYGLFDLSYSIAADYDLMMRFLVDRKTTSAYLPEVLVKMRVGGISNRNLGNMFKKSFEDLRVLKQHSIPHPFMTLIRKNLSKVPQWFIKPAVKKEGLH